MGRATIEAVLLMSVAQVAGLKQQGSKADRDIAYHGSQEGKGTGSSPRSTVWACRQSELRRCLGTTNIIDNGLSALRDQVRRVRHWQRGSMAVRWTAAALDAISEKFRRIMDHAHQQILKAALDEKGKDRSLADQARTG